MAAPQATGSPDGNHGLYGAGSRAIRGASTGAGSACYPHNSASVAMPSHISDCGCLRAFAWILSTAGARRQGTPARRRSRLHIFTGQTVHLDARQFRRGWLCLSFIMSQPVAESDAFFGSMMVWMISSGSRGGSGPMTTRDCGGLPQARSSKAFVVVIRVDPA